MNKQQKIRLFYYFIGFLVVIFTAVVVSLPFYRYIKDENERKIEQLSSSLLDQKKLLIQTVIHEKISDLRKHGELYEETENLKADLLISRIKDIQAGYSDETALRGEINRLLERNNAYYRYAFGSETLPDGRDIFLLRKTGEIPEVTLYLEKDVYEERLKKSCDDIIRETELPDNGYVWVNEIIDFAGGHNYAVRRVHPGMPETEGMLLSTNMTDIRGNFPYREELEGILARGELFFEYYFEKKDSDIVSHKLTFARLYEPFNWIVATGIYLDDLDELISRESELLEKMLKRDTQIIIGGTVAAVIMALLLFAVMEIGIDKMRGSLVSALEEEKEELAEAYRQLEEYAYMDSLTNLWNRRGMMGHLKREVSRTKREDRTFCLLLGDIDFFKKVNDNYGHNAGDLVLVNIASALANNCRSEDITSRWGGEEFLLLINSATRDEGIRIAEKLRKIVEDTAVTYGDNVIKVTMTLGVALFNGDKSLEEVINEADDNLYDGKSRGRNCVIG